MKKIGFYLILIALIFPRFLFSGEQKILRFKVDHLACESCAKKFRSTLSSVCKDLTLDLKQGEAVYINEESTTPQKILSQAKKAGFPIKQITDYHQGCSLDYSPTGLSLRPCCADRSKL